MISICIPIYNFDVTPLVDELLKQISGSDCEIVLIDDASTKFKSTHQNLKDKVRFIDLEQNIGRAKIRNLFLQHTKHDYLLFLDCDSLVEKNDFVETYIDLIKENQPIISCGGRVYPKSPPAQNRLLRWKYGVESESKSQSERSKHPNRSFMTNNFLVNRSLFEQVRFDENLTQYGHEDTLFGFELKKLQIPIVHVENPILNGELETNEEFLLKTELGIQNLVKIVQSMDDPSSFIDDVHLLSFHKEAVDKVRIGSYKRLNAVFGKQILRKLKRGTGTVKQFNFYKLMLLIKYLNAETRQ